MPKRDLRLSCFVCGLLFATATLATGEWVALDGARPLAPVVKASAPAPEKVIMEITVPGFQTESVTIEGQPFAKIVLPDHVQMLRPGFPQLPVVSRSLVIPDLGDVAVRVVAADYRELPMDRPAPSKGDLPRTIDPATIPYSFGSCYRDGGVWPGEPVELGRPFILRDLRGVSVHIYPFRYDFARGVMLVAERLTLEITTSGTGGVNPKVRQSLAPIDPQFAKIYRNVFLNRDADKYAPIARPGPMLIVTADAFASPMAPFVAWKQQCGIPVEMITISSIGGTASGVQNAILSRYQSAAGLTYVILVGDIAQVPTKSGTVEGADSDPMYAMLEGDDSYPDLFISRISAQTLEQVQIQVAKFIRYEKQPDTGAGADWYHLATGIASNESGGTGLYDYERMDLLRDDLLGYTFTDVDQIYQGMGGSTAAIAAALNDGRSLVNYIGHGSGTSWSSVYFGNSDIQALTNGWMQPWIVDVSCSNGDFSLSECFAEAWLRAGTVAQPKGAVATYSASTSASWVPPCVMQTEVIDLLVAETENSLGALYFSGAMKTLDDYPPPGSEGLKLMQQYNIFGDCSLVVRTDVPAAITASHAPVLPLGAAAYEVDVPGLAGATACLWRDGVIHGAAVTDGSGHATIALDPAVETAGEVTLTVTAYNHEPYQTTVMAIVPATVIIDPTEIDADRTAQVTVTVYGSDGVTPQEGIDVWAEGINYQTNPVATDPSGIAVLTVRYPYGPSLDIAGQDPAESYRMFTEAIAVNALPLTGPDLTVRTSIGLNDAFALNLPGILTAFVTEAPDTLYALLPDGTLLVTASGQLEITPAELGEVTGMIGVPGYDLYTETFAIIEAYGTLSGVVTTAERAPLSGVTVQGYDAAMQLVFAAVTNESGQYDVGEDILVADYTIVVDHFGYLHFETPYFLNYGVNVFDVELTAAPSGILAGAVTESGTGDPLEATVKVYRSDTMELHAQTGSDPGDGSYATPPLPFFDYRVTVNAPRHIPVTIDVTVDEALVAKDFSLEETIGDILLIDDEVKARAPAPVKTDKAGTILAEAYEPAPPRAAQDIADDLMALGFTVTQETSAATDPATWPNYDLVIVSCGAGYSPVGIQSFRDGIESYVLAGGHLLIEGGELGYDSQSYPGYPSFAANVLHIAAWNHDSSGSVTVAAPAHCVMSIPNTIAGPIAMTYGNYGDEDAVTVASDAAMVGSWSSYPSDASVVAYDPNPAPLGGQIVYFTFNYAAMDPGTRLELLQNSVNWLLTPEVGDCGVTGWVQLYGESDYSGVTVQAIPNGGTELTDAGGGYALDGLFAGTYQITVSKAGWSTRIAEITLGAGEQLTGLNFYLTPVQTTDLCQSPALAIPDNNPLGVSDTMPVAVTSEVTSLEVFLDITHTYIGDLIVELTSPLGTTVKLHNLSGGTAENIFGWYPSELTPAQSLDAFIGEPTEGDWTLHVSDNAGADLGTLNQWCLRLTSAADLSGWAEGGTPSVALALHGNTPNPFNPRTKISFSIPQPMEVELAIFNLQGRRVAMLVSGLMPAGRQDVFWDGKDGSGQTVSSGLYVYRFKAGDFVQTRKMTLMK
jgi:subtilisin-like proprotein convertase family protein